MKLSEVLTAKSTKSAKTSDKKYFGCSFDAEDSNAILASYNKATGQNVTIENVNRSAVALYIFAKFVESNS